MSKTKASGSRVPIPNTSRRGLRSATEIGPADPQEQIEVTIYVRRNPRGVALPSWYLEPGFLGGERPELNSDTFSAAPEDIERVVRSAKSSGLEVLGTSVTRRTVIIRGTAAALEEFFDVDLRMYEYPLGRFRGRLGPISISVDLDGIVEGVFGLDNRRVGQPYLRQAPGPAAFMTGWQRLYFPPQVAQLYNYPRDFDGKGECIAILAFNDSHHGGYNLGALRSYFSQLQLPMPEITDVVVHGVGNDPGDDGPTGQETGDSSGEIMLDIQVAGAMAPGARLVVYFTEFTERGWVDAMQTIVTDTQNKPSVLSISYGNPEDVFGGAWTRAAMLKVNEAFGIAATKQITVCCASGDQGSTDVDFPSRQVHVDFPGSSPLVLSCGGTRLDSYAGVITRETVWNDGLDEFGGLSAGGGGISAVFPLPYYQSAAGVPPSLGSWHQIGRGVPDVSGLADPATPMVVIRLNGTSFARVGGTSVTAPLWAALIARLNQALGRRVGFLNPVLYSRFSFGVLRDIIQGNNGSYTALPGWDACTGLGSPDGMRLLQALQGVFPKSDASSGFV